jgi:hypothetical protein
VTSSVAEDQRVEVCRPDPIDALGYPQRMVEPPPVAPDLVELPIHSLFLTLGQIALGLNAVAIALVLATVPSGSARIVGVIAAIVVIAVAVWLIRALRRQAIIVDGQRLGYRRGPMGRVSGWTDLADVEAATLAKMSTSVRSGHRDVILWTRVGGVGGLSAALLRAQAPKSVKHLDDVLHPFLLPLSALGEVDRSLIESILAAHGLSLT